MMKKYLLIVVFLVLSPAVASAGCATRSHMYETESQAYAAAMKTYHKWLDFYYTRHLYGFYKPVLYDNFRNWYVHVNQRLCLSYRYPATRCTLNISPPKPDPLSAGETATFTITTHSQDPDDLVLKAAPADALSTARAAVVYGPPIEVSKFTWKRTATIRNVDGEGPLKITAKKKAAAKNPFLHHRRGREKIRRILHHTGWRGAAYNLAD